MTLLGVMLKIMGGGYLRVVYVKEMGYIVGVVG